MVASGSDDNRREATPGPEAGRKPYLTPELRIYGSLARITGAVGFMGKADGGKTIFMRKTA